MSTSCPPFQPSPGLNLRRSLNCWRPQLVSIPTPSRDLRAAGTSRRCPPASRRRRSSRMSLRTGIIGSLLNPFLFRTRRTRMEEKYLLFYKNSTGGCCALSQLTTSMVSSDGDLIYWSDSGSSFYSRSFFTRITDATSSKLGTVLKRHSPAVLQAQQLFELCSPAQHVRLS